MFWHDGMGVAGWWGLGLGMVLFWGLVIAAIVVLVRWAAGSGRGHQHGPMPPQVQHGPAAQAPPSGPAPSATDAHRILDERFARGEIDEDEYRRRRDVLRGG